MNLRTATSNNKVVYLAWLSATLFFMYQYILRVSPGILVDEIRTEYKINADQFSLLGSLFYYSYAFVQIPMGILLDKIGIRATTVCSIALCVLGGICFSLSDNIYIGYLSRVLMGAGAASSFMSALKIAADYLPEGRRGLMIGATLTMGTITVVGASSSFIFVVEQIGWRDAFLYSTLIGIFVAILSLIFIPKHNPNLVKVDPNYKGIMPTLLEVIKNKKMIIYSIVAIGLYTPLAVIADLWGTAFLMQKYQLTRADAASSSMMVYLGMAIGSLVLPALAERYKKLNLSIRVCGLLILVCFAVLVYGEGFTSFQITCLLVFVGFLCGAEMICFTAALLDTTKANSGITIGFVNTMNMLGGALLQQAIGIILDLQWDGKYNSVGIRAYSAEEYTVALSSILVVLILTSLLAILGLRKAKTQH